MGSIKRDNCEEAKYTPSNLCMVFYILRNICFYSFKIIKGFNSIEYIRYPEWKIGYQGGGNSLKIYSFFNTHFWLNELEMSDTFISDMSQNIYPYSLSQK